LLRVNVTSTRPDLCNNAEQMQKRRPTNVVVVALANKMARMIWAVLAHGRPYRKDYVSVKPA
ncbi:TPA: IS110 family transposase, partial [Burkholderia orbicola]